MECMEGKAMMQDLVRNMTPQQMAEAYDRGAITWAAYEAALDYHKREIEARVRAGKAPAKLLDGLHLRMTDRDGQQE